MHQAVFLAESAMLSEGWLVSCLIAMCRDYGLAVTDMIGGDRMSFKRSGQTELTLAVQVWHSQSKCRFDSDIVDRTLPCHEGSIKISLSVLHPRHVKGLKISNSIPANCCDAENRAYL